MLRDNLVGLIEPMFSSAGAQSSRAAHCNRKSHRTIDPHALKIPAPKGRNSTLTENATSPFHAEPRQFRVENALALSSKDLRAIDRFLYSSFRGSSQFLFPAIP